MADVDSWAIVLSTSAVMRACASDVEDLQDKLAELSCCSCQITVSNSACRVSTCVSEQVQPND